MRSYLLTFWKILDPFYYSLTRLEHIGIFRVRLTTYKGRDVLLNDGTLIKKNDKLVKIHLHNIQLLSELKTVSSSVKRGRIIFRKVHMSLPLLAEFIHNHNQKHEIKGAIGISMLHKGVEKLGFETYLPSNQLYRFYKKMTHIPLFLLSKEQPQFSKIPDTNYLFISKEKLKNIYSRNIDSV